MITQLGCRDLQAVAKHCRLVVGLYLLLALQIEHVTLIIFLTPVCDRDVIQFFYQALSVDSTLIVEILKCDVVDVHGVELQWHVFALGSWTHGH